MNFCTLSGQKSMAQFWLAQHGDKTDISVYNKQDMNSTRNKYSKPNKKYTLKSWNEVH